MDNKELTKNLNSLLFDEYVAIYTYFITSRFLAGKAFTEIEDHFEEHIKEEVEHADIIIEILQQSKLPVNSDITSVGKKFESFDINNLDQSGILGLNRKLEQDAIKNYTKFYQDLGNDYPSIQDKIIKILNDEKEHELDLAKYMGSSTSTQSTSIDDKTEVNKKIDKQEDFSAKRLFSERRNIARPKMIQDLYNHVQDSDKQDFIDILDDSMNVDDIESAVSQVEDLSKPEYNTLLDDLMKLHYKNDNIQVN